jgi:hypothetical protein
MKKCAFLSMDSLANFYAYDELLVAPMRVHNWQVETVSWRDKRVNWHDYDVVVIRSCWDYQADITGFLHCLKTIEESRAILANSLPLVYWNIHKTYLKELAQQGISIVPSLWCERFKLEEVSGAFSHFACDELVIKPIVSANADHTYRLNRATLMQQQQDLALIFSERPFMLQPFLHSVVTAGEYSLFYFAGHFSHCIVKQPKSGDFRVQEEHGGQMQLITADESLLTAGRHVMAALPAEALYARVDLVSLAPSGTPLTADPNYALMEVELIEPSLYFNMDPQSPQRFVQAFVETFGVG